jgi:hypothetical protein
VCCDVVLHVHAGGRSSGGKSQHSSAAMRYDSAVICRINPFFHAVVAATSLTMQRRFRTGCRMQLAGSAGADYVQEQVPPAWRD